MLIHRGGAENTEAAQRFNRCPQGLGYPLRFLRVLCVSAVVSVDLSSSDLSPATDFAALEYHFNHPHIGDGIC
jgi:hypothetical protein